MIKFLQWLLITIRVAKWSGKRTRGGKYITEGFNKRNPLSYIVLIIGMIVAAIYGFFNGAIECYKETMN